MATRPKTRSMDENVGPKQGKAVQGNNKRRALGDIGNIQAAAPAPNQVKDKSKVQPSGKGDGAKDKAGCKTGKAQRRVTRSQTRAMSQGSTTGASTVTSRTAANGSKRLVPTTQQHSQQQRQLCTQPPLERAKRQPSEEQQPQPQQRRPVSPLPDIDGPDRHNHLAECLYVNDIYAYFRHIEPKYRASSTYMESQPDINEKMRAILIDWLVEVHLKFKLMPESLFLTINLIDRYLAVRQVTRKNLQLVGVTAMLVAAKYEEIWAPEVRDFVYISDKAYTRKQILDMEKDMLRVLDYNLSLPTSYQFLARLLKAANVHYDKDLALFVAYSAELCLVDYRMLRYSYSELAAGIMYVAMRAFNKPDPYPYNLMRYAHFSKEAVLHISQEVVKLVQNAHNSSLQAVVKKYSTTKFCEAAMVTPPLDILSE